MAVTTVDNSYATNSMEKNSRGKNNLYSVGKDLEGSTPMHIFFCIGGNLCEIMEFVIGARLS